MKRLINDWVVAYSWSFRCCFWAERETGLQSKRNLELQPRPQGGSLALGVGRPTSKAREKRPGDEVARARVPQENACNVGFKYQINLHLPSLVFLRLLCRLLTLQLAAPSDSGLFLLASFLIWKTNQGQQLIFYLSSHYFSKLGSWYTRIEYCTDGYANNLTWFCLVPFVISSHNVTPYPPITLRMNK